ncbi:MAG: paraquat-inducible protein A [Yoonia sp.]|uniref:paraquat-inducible protein A n=1 Tax=Yoonia sp. TaxID=2212373 RepID=UPI0021FC658D|nr:paraquat-inducible protein A [Rhodobacteraceae bacterium S2214]
MPPLEDLIACPHCDTLHTNAALAEGAQAHCVRCGVVLKTERATAIVSVLALSITSFLLMVAAISFPFLNLSAAGQTNSTSVLGAVMAFSDTFTLPLAAAVAAFIIFLPLIRLGAIIMAVTPLVAGTTPSLLARRSFGLSETLRPWSMAEIFIVGVAVALVKVAGLASIAFGPAFWAFTVLVVLTFFQDTLICRYSIWRALDTSKA